jgi:Raf kinase inhibitor-like YbhB/YbcL family protein
MVSHIERGWVPQERRVLEKLPLGLGQALAGQRAGLENIAYHRLLAIRKVPLVAVHSSAFNQLEHIPVRYTADGDGISPPLEWFAIPGGATSVVVMVEDGDSPTPHPLVHAIAVNLDPERRLLGEGALMMGEDDQPAEVDLGLNSLLKRGWTPPDPPPGHGRHRYGFQVFALREGPALHTAAGRHEVLNAILSRAIAAGCLIGTYERAERVRVDERTDEEAPALSGADPVLE